MTPSQNPTIEEQALARIHRIGQTRPVTTVRFYVQGSFEKRVMEVQESKKNLAGVLLSGHDGGRADDSLGALQVCSSTYPIIRGGSRENSDTLTISAVVTGV